MRRATATAILVASAALGLLTFVVPEAFSQTGGGVIAYSVKTGIYAINANGTGRRLLVPWQAGTCGQGCVIWKVPRHPRYSPDGDQLTYDLETNVVRRGVGELQENTRAVYIANADGGDRREIGLGHDPAFAPNGEEVVYSPNPNALPPTFTVEEVAEPFEEGFGPLDAFDIATGGTKRLPVPGAAEFSSSGEKMLFVHQVKLSDGLHTLTTVENLDGSDRSSVSLARFYAEPPRFTTSGEVSYDCPALSGRQPDICVYDPATGKHRRLFHIREFWALEAASSPNGARFAVAGLQGLYVTDANGDRARRIVANGSGPGYVQSDVPTSPVWRPSR